MCVCMVNAFRLYSKFSLDERKKDHRCFRISLIQQLITEVGGPRGQSVRRGQPILGEMPARLVGQHFPEFKPAKAGAKRLKPLRDCVGVVTEMDSNRSKRHSGVRTVVLLFVCQTVLDCITPT